MTDAEIEQNIRMPYGWFLHPDPPTTTNVKCYLYWSDTLRTCSCPLPEYKNQYKFEMLLMTIDQQNYQTSK